MSKGANGRVKVYLHNKLITCVVPRGLGSTIVEALKDEHGIMAANFFNGRGVSSRKRYFAEEVDVLTVIVNQSRAEEIFGYLCGKAEVMSKRGRLIFQHPLETVTSFVIPEIPDEEGARTP